MKRAPTAPRTKRAGMVLAGSFFGGTFERACTVPPDKALFFPIVNAAFGAAVFDCEPTQPGVPCNITVLRAAAAASMDRVTIEASIDGVPVRDLRDYRVQSPVFSVTLPEGNVVDVPSGTYAPMVSDGYWLMLAPASQQACTIHFTNKITGGPFAGTATEEHTTSPSDRSPKGDITAYRLTLTEHVCGGTSGWTRMNGRYGQVLAVVGPQTQYPRRTQQWSRHNSLRAFPVNRKIVYARPYGLV